MQAKKYYPCSIQWMEGSVTRLDDLLDFGPFLKALATKNLPKSPTFLGNFCKGVKIYHFSSVIILGNFYRHLAIFSGHTACYGSLNGHLLVLMGWSVGLFWCSNPGFQIATQYNKQILQRLPLVCQCHRLLVASYLDSRKSMVIYWEQYFSIMVSHFKYKQRCLVENNVITPTFCPTDGSAFLRV